MLISSKVTVDKDTWSIEHTFDETEVLEQAREERNSGLEGDMGNGQGKVIARIPRHRFFSDFELIMAQKCQGIDKQEYEMWIRKWIMKNPEFRTKAKKEATEFIREYILLEDKMLDWIFEEGELEFFSKKDLANYMRYRLDDALTQLDLGKPFGITAEEAKPMLWFEEEVFVNELDDFFAKRPTAYTKHDKSITANDLF